jgi:hypothetical protein
LAKKEKEAKECECARKETYEGNKREKVNHAEENSQLFVRTKKIEDTRRTTTTRFEHRMDKRRCVCCMFSSFVYRETNKVNHVDKRERERKNTDAKV